MGQKIELAKLVIREILISADDFDISTRDIMLILNFNVFPKIIKNINFEKLKKMKNSPLTNILVII